jgi:hypothetical protein
MKTTKTTELRPGDKVVDAANEEFPVAKQRQLRGGWDPYDVWRTRVLSARSGPSRNNAKTVKNR